AMAGAPGGLPAHLPVAAAHASTGRAARVAAHLAWTRQRVTGAGTGAACHVVRTRSRCAWAGSAGAHAGASAPDGLFKRAAETAHIPPGAGKPAPGPTG
ncbi:hypothetical protein CUR44_00060, partial [Enterococcus faecalis]